MPFRPGILPSMVTTLGLSPIILCTGFSEQVTPEEAKKIGVRQYLQKPVEMEDLWRSVRQSLDHPEGPPRSQD